MSKVLVIEDDNLLSKELTRALSEHGIASDVARTLEGARGVFKDILDEDIPNLVFLDVMLGEENGLALLKEIKADEKFHTIPVIMLTNAGPITDVNRAMELGASDYVVKANTDLEKIVELAKKYLMEA